MEERLYDFVSGVLCAANAVAAVFFLKFFFRTRDRLFLAFAVAFILFSANQALSGLIGATLEERTWTYLLRLAGFSFLIVAILGKTFQRTEK